MRGKQMTDTTRFPDPTYRDTVLAPLFEGVKSNFATHMAQINRAHLVMLAETGILSTADARSIASALSDIEKTINITSLTYTGEHEDYFFVVEAALRERLGDPGGALHTARSRNDMDHTLFKLALRQRTGLMLQKIFDLVDALIKKAETESETLIVAYTHGQPAQPTTFGHYLSAIVEVMLRDAERLDAAANGLEHCPMGAAAITTSGFPIDRDRMSDLLGFEAPLLNAYGCIASVDYVTALYSTLKLVFVHLGRVVQDMGYWAAFEVGQLYVPNSFVQISSIMPQKRNPVPIEHMRHLASVTAGRCDVIVNTMHNTPYTDMNDSEGEVQQAGYDAFASGARMIDLFRAFLPACSINADRVAKTTDAACITITELADTLVRDEGLSFRQAHEISALTAKAVIAKSEPLHQGFGTFVAAFADETGRETAVTQERFEEVTSARHFVKIRNRPGGPAPEALQVALSHYKKNLTELINKNRTRSQRHSSACEALDKAFMSYVET